MILVIGTRPEQAKPRDTEFGFKFGVDLTCTTLTILNLVICKTFLSLCVHLPVNLSKSHFFWALYISFKIYFHYSSSKIFRRKAPVMIWLPESFEANASICTFITHYNFPCDFRITVTEPKMKIFHNIAKNVKN